jgi:hypothetical protein
MRLRSTSQIDDKLVEVEFPNEDEFSFTIGIEPPKIKLYVSSFREIVRRRHMSFQEATHFVRYLIEGVATTNRKWALCKPARFYSDLEDLTRRGIVIQEFQFPSEEELARL